MAARVDVSRVDGLGEQGGGAVARGLVGAAREPLQLGELDDVGPVAADLVLAVLLRPVERAVGEPDQLVAADALRRERGDARADGQVDTGLERGRREPSTIDVAAPARRARPRREGAPRTRRRRGGSPRRPGADGRDLREHAVADGWP